MQVSGSRSARSRTSSLTPDGQAELTLSIDDELRAAAPGHAGHRPPGLAVGRRQPLRRPPAPGPTGRDPRRRHDRQSDTTTAVDLDQLFNTLDEQTRKDLQSVIKGLGNQYHGQRRGRERRPAVPQPVAVGHLAPVPRAQPRHAAARALRRLLVELVTDLADRREDLAGLVDNLATTTGAIGPEQEALADAVEQLPPFMRRANTTFVNLRATLDDLDPLVDDPSRSPRSCARLAELRPLAQDARPDGPRPQSSCSGSPAPTTT